MIVKEGLNNVLKHSHASEMRLYIGLNGKDHMEVMVEDNGTGYESNTVKSGNGLQNIAKRAGRIGAVLSIVSQPGQGSTLQLQLHIPKPGD